jgi:hypothetical protein
MAIDFQDHRSVFVTEQLGDGEHINSRRHKRRKAVFFVTTVVGLTGLWIAVLADTGAAVLVTANALRLLGYAVRK